MLALALALPLWAADPNAPHEHQGVLTAYKGAPSSVSLTADDLTTLATGASVQKQVQMGNGGRAVAVMDINASVDRVWSRILAFDQYPNWVDNVTSCSVYKNDSTGIFAEFVLGFAGASVQYYIKHTLNRSAGWMTWTLDYSRNSDLNDSVGYWRVTPISTEPPKTRLEYSVEIQMKGWVPGFIVNMVQKQGVTNATAWVKKQSEG